MTLKAATFTRIRKLVYERAALVLEDGKEYLVENRLAPIARAHGFETVDDLCQRLSSAGEDLLHEVVEAMTTNETSFFRDHHPFEALRRDVLPQLIAARAKQRSLRVWCAACSTGQEPYSLAMLLDEHFPQLASWSVRIDATDVSRTVLSRAKRGHYSQIEVNRGLSVNQLARYFVREGQEWEVRSELKRRVQFRELNLIGPWPTLEAYDIVFLRNVLIYFDQATKLSVLTRIRQQLAEHGYLVLGGSESMPQELASFERLPVARAGIYQAASGARKLSYPR